MISAYTGNFTELYEPIIKGRREVVKIQLMVFRTGIEFRWAVALSYLSVLSIRFLMYRSSIVLISNLFFELVPRL